MPASAHAHPHALPGTLHAPAGMLLPGGAPVDATRADDRGRNALDVVGGVAFAACAFIVGILYLRSHEAHGWAQVIGRESVWLVAALVCAPLMPSGIRHDISWRSTWEGLRLDWPELAYGTWVIGMYTAYLGSFSITPGPLGLALAVGTAEEMLFRVLLLGWLVSRVSAPAALTISAVAFGAAHLHEVSLVGILSVVPQTAGGFVLGAVYLRTRNPIGPILAHAFWDLPYFVAMGAGVSGGGTAAGIPSVVDLVPWMAFAVYGLWLVRHGIPVAGRVDPVGCSCRACTVHPPAAVFT